MVGEMASNSAALSVVSRAELRAASMVGGLGVCEASRMVGKMANVKGCWTEKKWDLPLEAKSDIEKEWTMVAQRGKNLVGKMVVDWGETTAGSKDCSMVASWEYQQVEMSVVSLVEKWADRPGVSTVGLTVSRWVDG
jgi:hypothetical protein